MSIDGNRTLVQFRHETPDANRLVRDDDGLLAWLRSEFGAGLRTVCVCAGQRVEYLHVREDIREQHADADLRIIGEALSVGGAVESPADELFALGDLSYVVRGFDEGSLVRISLGPDRELDFSVDDDVALDTTAVVPAVRDRHDLELA